MQSATLVETGTPNTKGVPSAVAVAIGRSTHTVVRQFEDDFEESKIPNSIEGVQALLATVSMLEMSERSVPVIFLGNKKWALAFVSALREQDGSIDLRYFARKKSNRGARENFIKFAKSVLKGGITGRPFIEEKRPQDGILQDDHPWYGAAMEYLRAANDVRRAKHLVLSTI